jgi:Leucine rich repeat
VYCSQRSGASKTMPSVDRKGSGNLVQDSIVSSSISNVTRDTKKSTTKQRSEARRLKLDSQLEGVDIGHVEDVPSVPAGPLSAGAEDLATGGDTAVSVLSDDSSDAGMLRSTSAGSTGSGLFSGGGMTTNKAGSGALFGKGSSLLFPTGVETPKGADDKPDAKPVLRQKINLLLDQCESVRWPYKKKLMLSNLGLNANDIPIKHLCGTKLGDELVKLSLMGNALYSIPPKLVTCLPTLKSLDLSQCLLHKLPERWKLPQLKRLNLSHNRLVDFPEEVNAHSDLDIQMLCQGISPLHLFV